MEKLTSRIFDAGMERLERVFNRGKSLEKKVKDEYFTALCYERPRVFEDAVQTVIETFKPYPSEPFPSVATIKIAVLGAVDEDAEGARRETETAQAQNTQELDFCERCRNSGLFLDLEDVAHFCVCKKGQLVQAGWGINPGDRKRQEKIQKALDRLPSNSGPVRGLCERNPAGFWESTKAEHEKWMAAERKKIAEMDARRIKDNASRKKGGAKQVLLGPKTGLRDAMSEALATIGEAKRTLREPEEGPFEKR